MLFMIYALAVLSIVMLVHELGHLAAAKFCGIRVISFSIGLGPRLWTKNIGGTFYSLSLIPLGGYTCPLIRYPPGETASTKCPRVLQALFPASEAEVQAIVESSPKDPGNFLNAKRSVRAFVLLSGVLCNLLFAVAIQIFQLYSVVPYERLNHKPVVGFVREESKAKMLGLQSGDLIVSLAGETINSWTDLFKTAKRLGNSEAKLDLQREDTVARSVSLTVNASDLVMKHKELLYFFRLGFKPDLQRIQITFFQAFYYGLVTPFEGMYSAFFGGTSKSPSDPYSEADELPAEASSFGIVTSSYELGKDSSRSLLAFLTELVAANLFIGILNLLPLPALDGGQLLVLGIECVRRRRISARADATLKYAGITAILLLTAIGLGADFWRGCRLLADLF